MHLAGDDLRPEPISQCSGEMLSAINGRRQDPLSGGLCAQFSFQEVYLLVDFCGMYFAEGGNTKG